MSVRVRVVDIIGTEPAGVSTEPVTQGSVCAQQHDESTEQEFPEQQQED
jgi:uncharacterized cupin superfamily protein